MVVAAQSMPCELRGITGCLDSLGAGIRRGVEMEQGDAGRGEGKVGHLCGSRVALPVYADGPSILLPYFLLPLGSGRA